VDISLIKESVICGKKVKRLKIIGGLINNYLHNNIICGACKGGRNSRLVEFWVV